MQDELVLEELAEDLLEEVGGGRGGMIDPNGDPVP